MDPTLSTVFTPGHSIPFPGQGNGGQRHPPQCGQKGKDANILNNQQPAVILKR